MIQMGSFDMNSSMSGNSVVKESQPSMYVCKLGVSRQAVEIIWTAHHVFDGIQSFWQPAFVLACEWKGSREAFRLTVPSQGLGKSWHSVFVQRRPTTW